MFVLACKNQGNQVDLGLNYIGALLFAVLPSDFHRTGRVLLRDELLTTTIYFWNHMLNFIFLSGDVMPPRRIF